MNLPRPRMIGAAGVLAAGALSALGAGPAAAAAPTLPSGYTLHTFARGAGATNPDDVTRLGGRIFVAYQNATAADGSGGASTVVAYRPNGSVAGEWTITGRVDGLAADPTRDRVIATVNEDANSTLYTIDLSRSREGQVHHYTYSPDPAKLSGGGTDAISVIDGQILLSASNPSPMTAGGSVFGDPAVFIASIPRHGSVAKLTPGFADNATATDAVSGQPVTLNLSDPDSNAAVPRTSPRFGGDFVLDSQGDSELIFDRLASSKLTRLSLSSSAGAPQVDDIRWADRANGTLVVVDQKAATVYAITGPFRRGTVFAAIPSGGPLAGVLGTINLFTGKVDPFGTGFVSPKGLLYLPGRPLTAAHGHKPHGHHMHGHKIS